MQYDLELKLEIRIWLVLGRRPKTEGLERQLE